MKDSITLIIPTIIIGSSLIITFHRWKVSEWAIDNMTRIPRRKSNYTILNSKVNPMEFMLGDIPDWIFCPPAVILPFKKSTFSPTCLPGNNSEHLEYGSYRK